jgi:hypothetical protein
MDGSTMVLLDIVDISSKDLMSSSLGNLCAVETGRTRPHCC